MPELALDDREWDAFASHLDCVGMTKLMWREASPHAGGHGKVAQRAARRRWGPGPAGGRYVHHAQQRADRQAAPVLWCLYSARDSTAQVAAATRITRRCPGWLADDIS